MDVANFKAVPSVNDYIKKHIVRSTKGLIHAHENTAASGMRLIAVTPIQGKFLSLLTTMSGARNVLELGALGGYSSIWFAQALKINGGGRVTSIEIESKHRDVSIANLEYAGFQVPEEAEVILGAGLDILPKLEKEIKAGTREAFDFIFIDADWPNQWNYFDWGVKLCKGKGSVLYVDNAVKQMLGSGVVGLEENAEGLDDLVENVGKDARVEAVVMPTAVTRDLDGFLMAVVK